MLLRAALLVIAVLLAAGSTASAVEIELIPVADNTMFQEDSTVSNGAGPQFYCGRTNDGLLRRALIRFDFTEIPAGAQIEDVSLRLTLWRARLTSDVTMHRVLADWGEAGSNSGSPGGYGAPAESGDATWVHRFYPDDSWSTPGGEYEPAVSAVQTVGLSGSYTWTGAGLVDDVQAWVSGTSPNFGWMLGGDEFVDQSAKAFDSREYGSSGSRPRLTVTYTVPVTAAEPIVPRTWSAVKSLHRGDR